jgi:hypothetical protein
MTGRGVNRGDRRILYTLAPEDTPETRQRLT